MIQKRFGLVTLMKLHREVRSLAIYTSAPNVHSKTFGRRTCNNARGSCSLVRTIIFPVAHYVNSFLSVVRANSVFPFRASFPPCRALRSLMLFCIPFTTRSRHGRDAFHASSPRPESSRILR